MLIKAITTYATGDTLTLGGNDDLIVGATVVLASETDDAVVGEGNNQTLTINGILLADDDGIDLDPLIDGGRATVTIGTDGYIQAGDDAVQLRGQAFDIVNNGLLSAAYGFNLYDSDGTSRITNTGTVIVERTGVYASTDGRLTFENTGRLISSDIAYDNGGTAADVILNKGFIQGDVYMDVGNDVFNGFAGRIVGTVYGGAGNDRFAPGRFKDVFDGGFETDSLDFRTGGAVKVALDGSFTNTGAAKGDTYAGFEVVLGSARNDRFRGDINNNLLAGNGGNDRLDGAFGQDTVIGGAGRDTLTGGGVGDDFFQFAGPRDGADVITDFSNTTGNDDTLRMSGKGFGFGPQPLIAERFFRSGATNQAQDGNDRFLFRTGDETLWFDRDGKGGAGPVLIADFGDGVRLTADDFTLF